MYEYDKFFRLQTPPFHKINKLILCGLLVCFGKKVDRNIDFPLCNNILLPAP